MSSREFSLALRALLLIGSIVPLALGSATAASAQSAAAAPAPGVSSQVVVALPQPDAELIVDGRTIPGRGASRQFQTPPLPKGATHRYEFSARWNPNTYTTITRSKVVTFVAGEPVGVDLSVEDQGDRVRVIYVPTPDDVARDMVRLAGVKKGDVVFEPGCGDARISIAAIRAGAARGICVDIDPERAEESRANVQAAGYADRIDVRLGDALDVKDLSSVNVVLLYMGDHFNLALRPILWRDLPVGARIVSHRFTMGDWKPDRTLSVNSDEGGLFDLHVWTITDAVKQRRQ